MADIVEKLIAENARIPQDQNEYKQKYKTAMERYEKAKYAAEILMRIGMGCISCPSALMESLGEACMVHGLDGEEVVNYLNQELELA